MRPLKDAAAPPPWTHEEAFGLARVGCQVCNGAGVITGRNGTGHLGLRPCNCVLRAIFKTCFARFCECCEPTDCGSVNLEFSPNRLHGGQWGGYNRPRENYTADFCIIAGRTLDPQEMQLFRLYFIHGLNWIACAPRLGLERGDFFHAVYRVEQKLGRAFRDTTPYPLYPIHHYFNGKRVELATPRGTGLVREFGRSKRAEEMNVQPCLMARRVGTFGV